MGKYQHFVDLSAAEFVRLRDDIERRGQLYPIVVDEEGTVLDGHQRRRACAELGIECQTIVLEGLTEQEKEGFAVAANAFRRHLTGVEKSKAISTLLALGWSSRRIGEAVGVSHQTVLRASGGPDGPPEPPTGVDHETGEVQDAHTEGAGGVDEERAEGDAGSLTGDGANGHDVGRSESEPPAPPATVTGKDGKTYPASKPKKVKPEPTEEQKAAAAVVEQVAADHPEWSVQDEFRKHRKSVESLIAIDPDVLLAALDRTDWDDLAAFAEAVFTWGQEVCVRIHQPLRRVGN